MNRVYNFSYGNRAWRTGESISGSKIFLKVNCDLDIQSIIDNLDNRFIIDSNDPLFDILFPDFQGEYRFLRFKMMYEPFGDFNVSPFNYFKNGNCYMVDNEKTGNFSDELQEMYSSYVIVDFEPTDDNIYEWLTNIIYYDNPDVLIERIEHD